MQCEGRCSFTNHYHARKKLVSKEMTSEEVIADIKAKYEDATLRLNMSTKKITEVGDLKSLVDEAIKDNLKNLELQCEGIKKLCKGFNLVNELSLVLNQLEAELRKIRNLQARDTAVKVIDAIRALIDTASVKVSASDVEVSAAASGVSPVSSMVVVEGGSLSKNSSR
jgi:hypothetical protein